MEAFFAQLKEMTEVSAADLPLLGKVCVGYFIYRMIMCYGILKNVKKILKLKVKVSDTKFIHRTFDCIHYVITGIIGVAALSQRPYGKCAVWAKECHEALGQNPDGFICTVFEKIYYIQFTAYYITDLLFIWTVREPVMFTIHHLVSIGMIFACVVLKSPVVGPSIMVLHDVVDIPLYVGKIFLYLGFDLLKDVSLVIFAIGCTWFRIVNYPIIIYHCLVRAFGQPEHPVLYRSTCVLLCILYCLHLIWEYKIGTNVYGIIKGQPIHDNRSDDEDEEESVPKTPVSKTPKKKDE